MYVYLIEVERHVYFQGEQLLLQLQYGFTALPDEAGDVRREDEHESPRPAGDQLPEPGNGEAAHLADHSFPEHVTSLGGLGVHRERGLAGAVRVGGEVKLGEFIDIELLGGLHRVDGPYGNEDCKADQEVIRKHVNQVTKLLDPHYMYCVHF